MNTLRKDALLNRQRIENKAIELFKQYGVETISMNKFLKNLVSVWEHFIGILRIKAICVITLSSMISMKLFKMNDVAASSNSKEDGTLPRCF